MDLHVCKQTGLKPGMSLNMPVFFEGESRTHFFVRKSRTQEYLILSKNDYLINNGSIFPVVDTSSKYFLVEDDVNGGEPVYIGYPSDLEKAL